MSDLSDHLMRQLFTPEAFTKEDPPTWWQPSTAEPRPLQLAHLLRFASDSGVNVRAIVRDRLTDQEQEAE